MTNEECDDKRSLLDKLIAALPLRLDWLDVLSDVWKVPQKAIPGQSCKGLYEVLKC